MRDAFYAAVTKSLFKGSLPDWQKEPLDRLIDEALARERSLQDTAYVLATAYHETGRFKPSNMQEIGEGEGKAYGQPVPLMGTGSKVTRWATYFGRGFVQLTWVENYAKMGAMIGVDLINNPERAKEPEIAAKVIWEGMIRGTFTGKSLADYISLDSADYVGARRIVNGTDRDELIAGYAREFEAALRLIKPELEREECPNPECPYRRAA